MRLVTAAAVVVLGLIPAVTGAATAARITPASDTTASLNRLRTGWDQHEPGLSPQAVSSAQFGEVFSTALNGQIYAQPLVVGGTVIVATENDWVYGLNASTGAIKWSRSLGTPWAIPDCSDLVPNIGITSTPVYDPSTGSVYTAAQIVNGTAITWRMFGLDVKSGAITLNRKIQGSPSNNPNISFDAQDQGQRAGLLLLHGWVYASFASHCDNAPWVGYIAGVNVTGTKPNTLWTDESGVTDDEAGIWQGGDGLLSDGPRRMIVVSGNGVSPAAGPGGAPPGQLAESVIRLAQQQNGTLVAEDFFSPANAPSLDAGDLDFGSGGPAAFPVGTTAYPHILVEDGKYGVIFLLNRDNLGGREQGPGGTDNDLYQSQAFSGLWGHPAIFEQSTSPLPPSAAGLQDYVYYVGRNDYLRAFQLGTTSNGTPQLADVANSTFQFGYTSGSPVVTSNGTGPSSAVVWVVDSTGMPGTGASLVAFDAVPQPASGGGLQMQEIATGPIGTAGQFSVAATSNGMVYVGTRDGNLLGFGVPSNPALRRSGTASFGRTPVGSASSRTATVTATRTVTVTGASASTAAASDPFTVGRVTETGPGRTRPAAVTFPVTLHHGDVLHAPVTFRPGAPGGTSGSLTFAVAGRGVPVTVPLVASATRTGLYATSTHLTLLLSLNDGTRVGPVPVGLSVAGAVMIVNGGTTTERITKVSGPHGGPLSAHFLPRVGAVLRPGQSVTVQVRYAPRHVTPSTAKLIITGSGGTRATVVLSGKSQPPVSKITRPRQLSFGDVPVGHTATRFLHLVNDGNQTATVLQTVLSRPFREPYKVTEGLPVNGGYDLDIPITFTPARAGHVTGSYTFSWSDWFGTHVLTVPITATGTG